MKQLLEFKNLKDLMVKLSDEKVCREYVEWMRWEGKPVCPFCNHSNPYRLRDGKAFRCSGKTCKKDFSLTVGTIFENSKIPLSTWLAAIYVLTGHKKGISSHQLSRDLGITQKTAWFVLHRVRLIMGIPESEPMDQIVEVDETYVGGKLHKMTKKRRNKLKETGMTYNKTAVMGLVQRDGKARLTVIGDRSFKEVIYENVDSSAVIMTDAHLGYTGLDQTYDGHGVVDHSRYEYRKGLAYTNTVEGFFSLFKRTIHGTYHQISPKHLHRYCAETTYRFNSRKVTDADRFRAAISKTEGRLKYKNLIQTQTPQP